MRGRGPPFSNSVSVTILSVFIMKSPNDFLVVQLKEILKGRGLSTAGNKSELILRLEEADPTGAWMDETTEDITSAEIHAAPPNDNESQHEISVNTQRSTPEEMMANGNAMRREMDLMRRERDLLAREMHLLRREAQAEMTSRSSAPSFRLNTNIRAISDLLSEFDGSNQNFSEWEKQLLLLSTTYELDENLAKILLTSKLKGNALAWFHSKSDHIEMSVEDLLKEIKLMFDHRPRKMERRRIFENKKWQKTETFSDYYHNKRILANQVPIEEDEIIDYLIDGIPDVQIKNQARMRSFESASKLLEALSNSLSAEPTKDQTKKETKPTDWKTTAKPKQAGQKRTIKCFNCRRIGHTADMCRQPKACYSCQETGHVGKDCPKKKTVAVNFVDETVLRDAEFFKDVIVVTQGKRIEIGCALDSGSPISFIKINCLGDCPLEKVTQSDSKYAGINNSNLIVLGMLKVSIVLENEVRDNIILRVVPNNTMRSPLVLGRDVLKNFGLFFNKIEKYVGKESNELMNIDICLIDEKKDFGLNMNPEVPYESKVKLLKQFKECYLEAEKPEAPEVKSELKLNLTDTKPFYFAPRRLSFDEKEKLNKILENLTIRGVIRPSNSEFAFPIVLTRKKTGELRLCVDYRTLNKVTLRDNYPLPLIDDELNALSGKKYFSLLDLKDGFNYIGVSSESIKFTSFVTPLGQFEYLKMPFGLKTAPSTFQRFINTAFSELIRSADVMVYLDVILCIRLLNI